MSAVGEHSASDSAIGYYYQGMYALLVLLDANDDACVAVETADDVTIEDGTTHLHQLKHSLKPGTPLTIKADGLWKTIKVWCDHGPKSGDQFILATCAVVNDDDVLKELTDFGSPRSDVLVKLFDDEATRVRIARAKIVAKGETKPYTTRSPGCEAWLALSPTQRQSFLCGIKLVPAIPNAADIPDAVAQKLKTCVLAEVRQRLVERLLEWWDRQVILSMLGRRDRKLSKVELLAQIERLIIEHSNRGLPDDVAGLFPDDLDAEMSGIMARQIELVSGGKPRIRRAAIARWRVRTQREKWLADDLSIAPELDRFDSGLVEKWDERFGPMQHDCSGADETECQGNGLQLLDWSHLDAHRDVQPIRPLFTAEYLVQGSFQQLADEKRIGWHPKYEEILGTEESEER
ncbi:MAG: hypothetical protein CME31_22480 [Gimesia sp.]|uniref:ABC-three component systems C-terminal domain-containing protein n=1 Tax=Gimesia maris TaxID=122 RepID=A0A3D3RDZ3_9PLAN|nr:hypothetical protein [Gimesia sp.]HCO27054.1 hypothetical protein [Gimesia maris]|tara:strand:- start:2756 stop:3967 length:1212 start_codon:yes stop_codon:yes gene_type:complete